MTREENLERLGLAIPALRKRLPGLRPAAEDGGGALLLLMATAWMGKSRMSDVQLEQMVSFIEGCSVSPKRDLNRYLPHFQDLWDTPVVDVLARFAEGGVQ